MYLLRRTHVAFQGGVIRYKIESEYPFNSMVVMLRFLFARNYLSLLLVNILLHRFYIQFHVLSA